MVAISQKSAALGSAQPRTLQASVIQTVYGMIALREKSLLRADAIARQRPGVNSRACLGDSTAPPNAWGLAVNITLVRSAVASPTRAELLVILETQVPKESRRTCESTKVTTDSEEEGREYGGKAVSIN